MFYLTFFSAVIYTVTSIAWSEFVLGWIVWSVAGCTFKRFWNERGCCSSFCFVKILEFFDGTLDSLLCRFYPPLTGYFIGLLDTLTVAIETTQTYYIHTCMYTRFVVVQRGHRRVISNVVSCFHLRACSSTKVTFHTSNIHGRHSKYEQQNQLELEGTWMYYLFLFFPPLHESDIMLILSISCFVNIFASSFTLDKPCKWFIVRTPTSGTTVPFHTLRIHAMTTWCSHAFLWFLPINAIRLNIISQYKSVPKKTIFTSDTLLWREREKKKRTQSRKGFD